MLTINDLALRSDLDPCAMSAVRGGLSVLDSWLGITNAPEIDAGTHALFQGQEAAVSQAYNIGGLNLVISDQSQNGIAGQVAV